VNKKRQRRWLIATVFLAALLLPGCSGDDGSIGLAGAPGPPGAPGAPGAPGGTGIAAAITVQGNVAGTAAPVALPAAFQPAALIPLEGATAVVMVDESGNQLSQVIDPADGQFALDVPTGHTYVVVFREGSAAGRTLGVLIVDNQSGRTGFYLPQGSPNVDLGSITIDTAQGKCWSETDPFLPGDTVNQPDSDLDGIPDVADISADEDGDGFADDEDPEPFAPLELVSLKEVPVPEPINLGLYLRPAAGTNAGGFPNVDPAARAAAIQLGKALFWDMNMGSDVQACASCHHQAGADAFRSQNNNHPGANGIFDVAGPNLAVTAADFPYVQFSPVDEGLEREGVRIRNRDDVMGSQGVFFTEFTDIGLGDFLELGTPISDPVHNVDGINTRRVTGRNAPSAINAVFNFTNFWDGRARNIFNGVNPFGELDQNSGVFMVGASGALEQEIVRIPDSSLASQAVGPPGSDVEMTFAGRPFVKIGKKLLNADLKPLTRQQVHPEDSVLGALADTDTGLGLKELVPGENTYVTLIKQTFNDNYWNSPDQHLALVDGVLTVVDGAADPADTDQFTQMEANFSLFFGLAVQLYEATLVSDDSKFDRVMEGLAEFTDAEEDGFSIFFGGGHCSKCHTGSLFTNHTIDEIRRGVVPQAPGFLPANAIDIDSLDGGNAFVDIGFNNIAVRPTADDLGWGGDSPFINPLTGEPFPLAFAKLALLKRDGLLPDDVARFVPDLPGAVAGDRVAVDGTFKVSGLRNVELNGPYFHNGSAATLMQVVEFYTRMGNFPQENIANVHSDFQDIGKLRGAADRRANLVAFLRTLTDERVKFERAPFDHPQFFLPAGDGLQDAVPAPPLGFAAEEGIIELPAVGAAGMVEPLQPFLNLDPVSGQTLTLP
jgi:cytochrome c peroxidase